MQKQLPEIATHLQELNIWPDTYLQKILSGLCIHVLRFSELFQFLDAFVQGGLRYLIRFCLALIEHFRSDILSVRTMNSCSTIYEVMRLDDKVADQRDIKQILARV
uniref:Carabin n=1 Tax=Lygus hesperus TaxID=30085 RepID=A0A0A9YHF0_LYGHE